MKRDKAFYSRIGKLSHAKRRGGKEYENWRKRRAKAGKETSKTKVRGKDGRWVKQK